jgi:hypothetical protein
MRLLNIVLTVALATFIVDGALADTQFQQSDTEGGAYYPWDNSNNWNNGIPAAGVKAIIPDGLTATVDSASDVCGYVDIDGTGQVQILASSKLTFDGDGSDRESTIEANGRVYLKASTSELAVIDDNHTISGAGAVVGEDNSATISIATSQSLTNNLCTLGIVGHLQINGAGNFTNQGIVNANASGTLSVAVTGALDDTAGSNRWKATASGAKLNFDSAIGSIGGGSLAGEFVISGASDAEIEVNEPITNSHRLNMSNGIFDVNQDLTMGDDSSFYLDWTGGHIEVAANKTFTHK